MEELHIGLQVESIGNLAFWNTVNSPKTKVYLPAKFDSDSEKDRIFGKGGWDQIKFFLPTLILDNTNYQQYTTYDTTTKQLQILRPITEISNVFQNGYPDESGGNLPIGTLVLPNTLVKIDDNAFINCTNLTNLNLGTSVQTIGGSAFRYINLTSATIPNSVEIVGYRAFANNKNLNSVSFGNNVKEIGTEAFYWCKLTNVIIPDSTTLIGGNSFRQSKLRTVVIGSNVQTIGSKAFGSIVNNANTTVSMPSKFNTKKLKDNAFGANNWTNITFTWT